MKPTTILAALGHLGLVMALAANNNAGVSSVDVPCETTIWTTQTVTVTTHVSSVAKTENPASTVSTALKTSSVITTSAYPSRSASLDVPPRFPSYNETHSFYAPETSKSTAPFGNGTTTATSLPLGTATGTGAFTTGIHTLNSTASPTAPLENPFNGQAQMAANGVAVVLVALAATLFAL